MAEPRSVYFHGQRDAGLGTLLGAGHIPGKTGACTRRRLDCHACVHLVAGDGFFTAGDRPEVRVSAGDLLLLFPGVEHSYGPGIAGLWEEWWLMFSGRLFTVLQEAGILTPERPVWRVPPSPMLAAEFDRLVEDRRATDPAREAELAARTLLLLTRMHGAAQRSAAPDDLIAAACALLGQHLERPLDLPGVAARLGLSYERFRKIFVARTGRPPARWRMERRIDRAKALLEDPRLTLAAVAERLGYCDVYFFARQFRQVAGITPGRFRSVTLGQAT